MFFNVSAGATRNAFVQSVGNLSLEPIVIMSNDLVSRKKRFGWILTVSALVFALYVLFGRFVGQLGFDFIVYYEPSSVAVDRRLPVSDRGNPEYAIRTVETFKEVESRRPTALMIHGDARDTVNFDFLRSEFDRGTIVIAVNLLPKDLDGLVAEGIQEVADVEDFLVPPFFTVLGKSEGHCPGRLEPDCGVFVVTARKFSGFRELTDIARDTLDLVMRGRLTPTATGT
jgi:hypothetical protein